MTEIQTIGLDKPFPLKYARQEFKSQQKGLLNVFAKNYEGSTNWIHLGLCFMDMVKKYDKPLLKTYLEAYTEQIKKYQVMQLHKKHQSHVNIYSEGMLSNRYQDLNFHGIRYLTKNKEEI